MQTHGVLILRASDPLTEHAFGIGRETDVRFAVASDDDRRMTGVIVRGLMTGRAMTVPIPPAAEAFVLELFDTALEISEGQNVRPWRGPRRDTA